MQIFNIESMPTLRSTVRKSSVVYDMGNLVSDEWEMPKKRKSSEKSSLMFWWILTSIFVCFLTFGGYFYQQIDEDFEDGVAGLDEAILITIQAHTLDNCIGTVESAFKLAANPFRLHVIIVNTNNTFMNGSCLKGYDHVDSGSEIIQEAFERRQLMELSIKETGIEYARTKAVDAIKSKIDEFDFIFETKVGALFTHRWDEEVINEWMSADDYNAILTTYPSRAEEQSRREFDRNSGATMNLICNVQLFNGLWFYTNPLEIVPPHHMRHTPTEAPFWSGLFSFGRIEYVIDVPHDPYLKHARFNDGIEFLYSARLLTSGYRMYAPAQDIIFYDYDLKSTRLRLFPIERANLVRNVRSDQYRIKVMMEMDKESKYSRSREGSTRDDEILNEKNKYGLGNQLTLDAFYDIIGVDIQNYRFSTNSLCKKIMDGNFRTESLA